MRLYSTLESVREREVTVLAVLETLLAVSITIIATFRRNTLLYMAFSITIAPFLLLRTEDSMHISVLCVEKLVEIGDRITTSEKLIERFSRLAIIHRVFPLVCMSIMSFFMAIFIVIYLTFIRLLSIIYSTIKHPLDSFKEIPRNWFRLTFTVDLLYPPEILPFLEADGVEVIRKKESNKLSGFQWKEFVRKSIYATFNPDFTYLYRYFLYPIKVFYSITIILLIFIPSLLYRLSIKSTSIIYLPLVYIVRSKASSDTNIRAFIAEILQTTIGRVKIAYAHFIFVFTILIPIITFLSKQKFKHWITSIYTLSYVIPVEDIIAYLFPVKEITIWHIIRSCNVLITLGMFHYAEKVKVHIDHGDNSMNDTALFLLTSGRRLRTLLSLVMISAGLYLLYSNVDWTQLPRIRWSPF